MANRFKNSIIAGLVLLIGVIGLGQGCSSSFTTLNPDNGNSAFGSTTKACAPPAGISGSPKTIEEAVSLINALPKPVTVPCFIESLDRPLNVSLTKNEVSAQAAVGSRSPRIFIIIDKLFISVVPDGLGRDYIEFSYLTAADMSIKAELEFPVVRTVSAREPYDSILYGAGTSCSVCHRGERRSSLVDFALAYESKALQPAEDTLVDLEAFRKELRICNFQKEPERCEMIKALLTHGEVRSRRFPAGIPTIN